MTHLHIQQAVIAEFKRLGITDRYKWFSGSTSQMKLPALTFTPSNFSDSQMNKISTFRREGRISTATYVHPGEDGSPGTGCVIWRGSEPTYELYS